MHFRSLRMCNDTALMVLVEDLTSEKLQLVLTQRHKESLMKASSELEERVRERTSELKDLNENLIHEIRFRKQAEHSLYASKASFTSIVEKTSEGILVVSNDNVVLFTNPAGESLLGRPREKLIGQHLGLRVVPGHTAEVKGKRLSGESGILELRVESTDWNEQPAKLLMLRDITERKHAEQEMLKSEKLESLELVAGGIAHDFNNLLTATIANISLAKMQSESRREQDEALRNAEKAAAGAKKLTQQLLTFTRGGDPVKRPASLSGLVNDTIDLALSGSHIKREVNLPYDLWTVQIDKQQIGQAIHNLLINSLQAMPDGGTLKVAAENLHVEPQSGCHALKEGRYVRISIRDTGCGIPEENLVKIFDPYFTTKPKGSGIGLASTYSVIKRHGGLIDVVSEVGVGTAFFVYLPATHDPEVEAPVDDWMQPPVSGTGRVLLMDDDQAILMVGKDLLSLLGYEVEVAADGAECIQVYRAAMDTGRPFSAVIMDLTIPGGMGGKVAIEKLLEIDPQVKAIVSSGYATDPIMSNHKHYGFSGIVAKPYNALELSRALCELLSEKSGQQSGN
jgi:two-component system cell cycle sensor histidine kinase/response regulator CckA